MIAKEKAQELVDKFYFFKLPEDKRLLIDNSKQCALICAETHLDYHENNSPFPTMAKWIDHNDYWLEVKEEIEKL